MNKRNMTIFAICLIALIGCNRDSFKRDALEASDIMRNAFNLEQFGSPKTISGDNTVAIKIPSRKDESISYLKRNKTKLEEIYNKIRKYVEKPNSKEHNNAILICIAINQGLFLLLYPPFENDLINKFNSNYKIIELVDDWVIDEFFTNLEIPEEFQKHWLSKEKDKKIKIITDGMKFKEGLMHKSE